MFRTIEELERKFSKLRSYQSAEWYNFVTETLEDMDLSIGGQPLGQPTPRWTTLRPHEGQTKLYTDPLRFKAVACGRRSGKSELFKRIGVRYACSRDPASPVLVFYGAPTNAQVEDIFWADLQALVPTKMMIDVKKAPHKEILLWNNSRIRIAGLDVPQRAEGFPIHGLILDEFANMHPSVWRDHLRPALADTGGWAIVGGVPEGRNHFFELFQKAEEDKAWGTYAWHSATVLPTHEVESARRDLDELTFKQEFQAEFITFSGVAYYAFDRKKHVAPLAYDPEQDLSLMLDFNLSPGVAFIGHRKGKIMYVIDEIYFKTDSTTPRVCHEFLRRYGDHQGMLRVYGDASGVQRHAATGTSNWDVVRDYLAPKFGSKFQLRVPRANPEERTRINAFNSALCTASGDVNFYVDPKCVELIKDLEGVVVNDDGTLNKADKWRTHCTDAVGYELVEHKRGSRPLIMAA